MSRQRIDAAGSQYIFPDSDGDGIEDRWDACIDEPENYNDYLDTDGCPDVLAAESTTHVSGDLDR